jgi:hypothetical protein
MTFREPDSDLELVGWLALVVLALAVVVGIIDAMIAVSR